MADVTTRYDLPFQEGTDPPDGGQLGQELAEAVEAALGGVDDRVNTLQATATGPSRGVVKFANRPTNKSCTTATTAILRLDSVPLLAGRTYRIVATGIRGDTDTSTGRYKTEIRMNTSGTAVVGTPSIRRVEAGDTDSAHVEKYYTPATNQTISLLLTANCYAGAATVNILGTDEGGIDMWVEDMGPAIADTGTDL